MGQALSLVLFAVAVVFYTLTQAIMHGRIKDNPGRKYAKPRRPPKGLYARIFNLEYAERFPGSATVFVSLTDRYHAFQFFFKLFLCISIVTYRPMWGWLDALLYFILFGIVFTITYRLT